MKHTFYYTVLLAFAAPLALSAQVSLYIEDNALVHVEGSDGVNNTLFVSGPVSLAGPNAILNVHNSANNGRMEVVDFGAGPAERGSITSAGQIDIEDNSFIQLQGNWTNTGALTSTAAGIVEFDGIREQTVDNQGAGPFGVFLLNNTSANANNQDVTAISDVEIQTGGSVTFNNGVLFAPGGGGGGIVSLEAGADFINEYILASGPAVSVGDDYINGKIRWGLTAATTYNFPTGDNNSAQPYIITFNGAPTSFGLSHLEVDFDGTSTPNTITNGTATLAACGEGNTFTGFTGVWDYEGFSGSTAFTEGAGTVVNDLGAGNYYALQLRPHNAAVPTGDVVMAMAHSTVTQWPSNDLAGTTFSSFTNLPGGEWHLISNYNNPQNYGVPNDWWYPCQTTAAANLTHNSANSRSRFLSSAGGVQLTTGALPVEMLPLTATAEVNSIRVDWTTLTEVNSSHFNLERSTDARSFEVVSANIPAAGNSNTPIDYSYTDADVVYNQVYYYRAHQFDIDGKSAYSNVAEAVLTNDGRGETLVLLYPNPADDNLNLQVRGNTDASLHLKLYDAVGKLVFENRFEFPAGQHNVALDDLLNTVAAGTYTALMNINGAQSATKLVLQR